MLANLVPFPNGPVTFRLSLVKRDASSPVKRDASSPVKRDADGLRSQRIDRLRDAQPRRCSRSDVPRAAYAAGL